MAPEAALDLSATEQAAAVRKGEVSARELAEGALLRAERSQGALGPFAHLDPERALASADAIDRGPAEGANERRADAHLAGVPYATKDLALACAGMPFTCGSRLFGDYVPDLDSAAAARPKAAGMTVLGTTRSCEFGLLPVTEPARFGTVRNPWGPDHTSGGSSGGAAAAVAAGVLAAASASDAGGSIRIPAACCGLVGLKPSRGRVSLAPFMGEHPFACEGVVSRSVADTAAMLDVLAGPEVGDSNWAPPPKRPFSEIDRSGGPLRIGVLLEPPFEAEVDERHRAAATRIGERLAELGHEVEDAEPFWANPGLVELFGGAWMVGAAAFAGWAAQISGLEPGPETLEPITLAFAERASQIPAPVYAGIVTGLQAYGRAVVAGSDHWDAVLSPTIAQRPWPVGALDGVTDADEALARITAFTPFTPVANISGQPAISVPAGIADDGMPVGAMLIGRPLGEATLLRLAAELEEAEGWTEVRPPAHAEVAA
jgi:amidase